LCLAWVLATKIVRTGTKRRPLLLVGLRGLRSVSSIYEYTP
jgi:hypothetical protein